MAPLLPTTAPSAQLGSTYLPRIHIYRDTYISPPCSNPRSAPPPRRGVFCCGALASQKRAVYVPRKRLLNRPTRRRAIGGLVAVDQAEAGLSGVRRSCGAPTRSSRPPRFFSRASCTRTGRGQRLHRGRREDFGADPLTGTLLRRPEGAPPPRGVLSAVRPNGKR
jgi:hypothetical protein